MHLYFRAMAFYTVPPNYTKQASQQKAILDRGNLAGESSLGDICLCCLGDKTAAGAQRCTTSRPYNRVAEGTGQAYCCSRAPPTPLKGKRQEDIMQISHLQHLHDSANPLSPLLSQQLPPSHLPAGNTIYAPHRRENLFKTLMTSLQLYQMVQ